MANALFPPPSRQEGSRLPEEVLDGQPQTPPLSSVGQAAIASPSENISAPEPAFHHRALSPLTLGELGLHPPAAPSALLDISTPLAIATAAHGTENEAQARSEPRDAINSQAEKPQGRQRGSKETGKSRMVVSTTDSSAFGHHPVSTAVATTPAAYHDAFLTSFLQSLAEEPLVSEQPTSMLSEQATDAPPGPKDGSACVGAAPNTTGPPDVSTAAEAIPTGCPTEKALSDCVSATMPQSIDQACTTDFRAMFQAATSTSSCSYPFWSLSPLTGSCARVSALWPSSTDGRATTSSSLPTSSRSSTANSKMSSLSSLLPFVSDNFLVTSMPLEPAFASSDPATSATIATKPNARLSREETTRSGGLPQQRWPLDLTNFSLPQAPPLQPEHRYPIQILETDGRYEPDTETDRESESGQRAATSPARSDGFCVPSKPTFRPVPGKKRVSMSSNQNQSMVGPNMASSTSTRSTPMERSPASVLSSSPHLREAWTSSTSEMTSMAVGALTKVSLSNVVRGRCWPNPSTESSRNAAWLVGSIDTTQAHETGPVWPSQTSVRSEEACLKDTSKLSRDGALHAPSTGPTATRASALAPVASTVASARRSMSHDFTRQALLDFIKRTNPVPASGAASNMTGTTSAKTKAGTQPDNAAAHEASVGAISGPFTSWSSTVPAELQAHLQNWQQQRKRQRTLREGLSDNSKKSTLSRVQAASTEVTSGNSHYPLSVFDQLEGQQARFNKRNASENGQGQTSRKHEQYERVFMQLQAKMRVQMQTQKQKQKETEDKTQYQDVSDTTGGSGGRSELVSPTSPLASQSHLQGKSQGQGELPSAGAEKQVHEHSQDESKSADPQQLVADMLTNPANPSIAGMSAAAGSASTSSMLMMRAASRRRSNAAPTMPASLSLDPGLLREVAAARWGQIAAPSSSAWHWNQATWPSFYNGDTASQTLSTPSTQHCWSASCHDQNGGWSGDIATDLMLKHPNWRRDLLPTSSLTSASNFSSNFSAPPFRDTSSLSISAAAGVVESTTSQSGPEDGHNAQITLSAASTTAKQPFSPGEEVVFWAVKGEYSVKLMGRIQSVSVRYLLFSSRSYHRG